MDVTSSPGIPYYIRVHPDCQQIPVGMKYRRTEVNAQSLCYTGYLENPDFTYTYNSSCKAIVEVIEILAKMLPEITIRYYFHSQEEDGIEYSHDLYYAKGELVDEVIENLDEEDE